MSARLVQQYANADARGQTPPQATAGLALTMLIASSVGRKLLRGKVDPWLTL